MARTLPFVAVALVGALVPRLASGEGLRMSLHDALVAGAAKGPGVAVALAPRAANERARDASRALLVSPPTLTVSAGPRFGAGTTLDLQVGAYVPIMLRDVSGSRRGVAEASARVTAEDVERARGDAALRAGLAWSRAMEATRILEIRKATLGRAEELVTLARRRVGAGVGRPSEIALAEGERAYAATSVLDGEGLLVDALVELRVASSLAPGEDVSPAGELARELPAVYAKAHAPSGATVSDSPGVRLAAASEARARAQVALTHATEGPQLSVGGMFAREGDGSTIALGSVMVPLPFVDPAAFDRSRAEADALAANAEKGRVRAELDARLSLVLHEMDHTREVRDKFEREVLPPLREALRQSLVEVSAGTTDIGPSVVARQRLLTAEEAAVRASAEVVRADLRYLHVTGKLASEAR
ncbi:MAG: TolC family protein [Myxococcales bacterium]|nr:TolC family protein [Myxococcales bacterium]